MAFWRPGDAGPGGPSSFSRVGFAAEDDDAGAALPHLIAASSRARGVSSSTSSSSSSSHRLLPPLPAERRALPIYEHRLAILHALECHGVVIIVGETGSGKSTRA
jgi:HrpA-like RNA helicase